MCFLSNNTYIQSRWPWLASWPGSVLASSLSSTFSPPLDNFSRSSQLSLNFDQVSPPYDPATILVGGGEGIPGKGETPIENLLEGVCGCWWPFREILFSWRLNSYQVSFLHCRFAFDAGAWKRWIPESLPDLPSPLPSDRCTLLVFWFTIYTYSIFLCQYLF